MSDPRIRGALDKFLILRILLKLACAGFGFWVAYYAYLTPAVIKVDQEKFTQLVPNSSLKAESALNGSKMLLFAGGSVIFNYILMIPFLLLKWHHPSQKNPNGLLQKSRPSLMLVMGAQFILAGASVVGIFLFEIGLRRYSVEPDQVDSAALIAALGISQSFMGNPFFIWFLTVGWALVVLCFLNFAIELVPFTLYKAALASISGAKKEVDYEDQSSCHKV